MRQIRGLQDDNERIAKMYQLVQNVHTGKPVVPSNEEVAAPAMAWDRAKIADKAGQQAKKGWQVASEDLKGSPAGSGQFAETQQYRKEATITSDQAGENLTLRRRE